MQELSNLGPGAFKEFARSEKTSSVRNNVLTIVGACVGALVVVLFVVFLSSRRRRGHSFKRDEWGLPSNPVVRPPPLRLLTSLVGFTQFNP